jgi:predicted acetyltransferase
MYEEMIEEWSKEEDFHSTSPWALFFWESYDEFLQIIKQLYLWKYKWYTSSSLFFLINAGKIIWWIDIRHNIQAPVLRDFGGHISYGIRPTERKRWYATELLSLGLVEAKKLNIQKILISHHPENIASQKVILSNGWKYFETKTRGNQIYTKYWITL